MTKFGKRIVCLLVMALTLVLLLVVIAGVFVGLHYLVGDGWRGQRTPAEYVETVLKCLAIIAAAGFFVYKIKTGWWIMNMSVAIRLDRKVKDPTNDHLSITVAMDKGSNDSVNLRRIQIRVTELESPEASEKESPKPSTETEILGHERLAEIEDCDKVDWAKPSTAGPISISPGEKTEFAHYVTVAHGVPVLVEAVVLGDRWLATLWNDHYTQWRVSAVSLPVKEITK